MSALAGIRVLELEAKGPAPFGVMLLADLGADVVRVERMRAGGAGSPGRATARLALDRGRRAIALDLKSPRGIDVLMRLIGGADVLVEGFRPGVAERLGFGPDVCLARNPRLVYARMTGWGQAGPLAERAAHDINYLAVAGALHPLGSADRPPPPPLNLVGDFGGGGTFLAIGVLAALLERERSGAGQVVDAAMVDGVAALLTAFHGLRAAGQWTEAREDNVVDGGAPWYRTYTTADDGYVAVGALEPAFYAQLLERLGLEPAQWPMYERERWPDQRQQLARIFAGRTRAEWEAVFEGSDACVTPVLTMAESTRSPHLVARGVFAEINGAAVPGPAVTHGRPDRLGPARLRAAHRRDPRRAGTGRRGAGRAAVPGRGGMNGSRAVVA
jgi:alpha-methylacyl-CoA racemase